MKTLSLAPVLAALASPVLAHEGHEAARELGLSHWLIEADHLAAMAAAVVVLVLARTALRRSRRG